MFPPTWLTRLLIRSGAARLVPGLQRRLDGGVGYLRYYSNRLLGSPLSQLERIAAALEDPAPDVIDLTAGSPRFDLLPASTTRLPSDRRGWPPVNGLPELRGAIASKLLTDHQLAYSPAEEILVTPGSLGAAQIIFDAFVNAGDAVVLGDPVSPLYPLLARTRGATVRWVGTTCEGGRLRWRLDQLAHRLRGARLCVVNSPNNPTGGVIAPEDLERLAWWCRRYDVLMLSDESFARYHGDQQMQSLATLSLARERTLTIGSVSKSHAMACVRVGWIAAYRHLLRPCAATAALRTPFVPTLSQQLAAEALRLPDKSFAAFDAQLVSRREYAFGRLDAIGLTPVVPAGGFLLWLPLPSGSSCSRKFAEALLRERRVKVLPGELFGPSGRVHIRLSLAVEDGRLDEGLNRLAEHGRHATLARAA